MCFVSLHTAFVNHRLPLELKKEDIDEAYNKREMIFSKNFSMVLDFLPDISDIDDQPVVPVSMEPPKDDDDLLAPLDRRLKQSSESFWFSPLSNTLAAALNKSQEPLWQSSPSLCYLRQMHRVKRAFADMCPVPKIYTKDQILYEYTPATEATVDDNIKACVR
jgi:hypothetical protein